MVLVASVFALILMMVSDAVAANINVVPTVRLEEGWNSNVFNTSTGEVSSFGTRLTPGLALVFRSPDLVTLKISGDYEMLRYSGSEAKNADSNTWFVRIDSTGAWALTPTFSMVPSVYYLNTTDSSRRSQLVPSGDPVLPPVTTTSYGNTNTENLGAGIRFNYDVTAKTSIGLSGNYSEQRFTDMNDNTAGSGLTNSTTVGAGASVSHRFSPRTDLGVGVTYSNLGYTGAQDTNVLSVGILFDYQFSPVLRIDGAFGVSHASQGASPSLPATSESAPSGLFNLSYTAEGFTARVFGSAVYSGGSGYGETTRQWTAGLAFADKFARDWSWDLTGSYQVSRSIFTTDAININTINGTAGLRYKPWELASIDLTGHMTRQTSDGQFGSTSDTYSAILGVTIGKPYRIY